MAVDNDVIVDGLLRVLVHRIKQTVGAERDRLIEKVIAGLVEHAQPSFGVFVAPGPPEAAASLADAKPAGRA